MNEQNQPDEIIALEIAASEFASAYSSAIGKLVMAKLNLIAENAKLKIKIDQMERELHLVKSQPEPEPESRKNTWDK